MKDFGPETFGERADGYDDWYGTRLADRSTADTVRLLAELAAGGSALELAIGTGRVALPLAAAGLEVQGIEASERMVAKLREKPGGDRIPVTIGDFADVGVDDTFDLIFVVFNTLFNLVSQEDQIRCFSNVARHLTTKGVFVVEAFVPEGGESQTNRTVRTAHVEKESAVLELSVSDPVEQLIEYQYIEFAADGIRMHPLVMRYAWPSELDLMARLAGLELRHRWAGWDRSPFTASSTAHVSVYAR
ncbi:MAG: class I SAM-dependent methyltransferase [Myxococcota bacterium]